MIFKYYTVKQHGGVKIPRRVDPDQVQKEEVDDFRVSLVCGIFVERVEHVADDKAFLIRVLQFFLVTVTETIKAVNEIAGGGVILDGCEALLLKNSYPLLESFEGIDGYIYVIINSFIVSHGDIS
jgi:hypothetical protein